MNESKFVTGTVLAALAVAMYSSSALAVDTSGTADVTVAAAITVTEQTTMNFGIMTPGTGNTDVTLTSAAATNRSVTAGDGTLVAGGTVAAGAFQISGTTGANVSISISDTGDLTGPGGTLTFAPNTTPSLGATHTIDATAANNVLYVGGTVTIPTGTTAGTYTNTTAYQVTVNYQ